MKTRTLASAPKLVPGCGLGRAIAAVAGLAMAQAAMGVSTVYTWIGVTSAYNNHLNWTPAGIPDAFGEAFLLNGGVANMSATSSVDWFNLQGGTLNLPTAVVLQVATQAPSGTNQTGIGGGGTIFLNSVGSQTGLRLTNGVAGDKFIWANTHPGVTATIEMGAAPNNIITGTVTGMLFVNQARVRGAGQIGLNILNIENSSGVPGSPAIIESSHVGATLWVDPAGGGFLNDGILRSSAGVLSLSGGTFTQTSTGAIELSGSDPNARIEVSGAKIVGGTVRQTAFGGNNFIDLINNTELNAIRAVGARMRMPTAHTVHLVGNSVLDATSTIFMNSVASATSLQPASGELSATLSGAGGVVMSASPNNYFRAAVAGQALTNDLGGGIVGSGQIGANLLVVTNNTFIEASGAGGITIDPPATGGFINNGTLRAAGGSTLTLTGGTITNDGGLIAAPEAGSVVVASGATVVGGTMTSANGGELRFQTNSRLENVTIAAGATARVPNAHTLHLVGTITNNGTISLDGIASTTALSTIAGDVVIQGTGQIVTSNATSNNLSAGTAGHRMTLNNAGGFAGSGQIGANNLVVVNNTTIASEGSAGLRIDPPPAIGFENNGTVRANAGSVLTILSGPFDNADGVIEVQSGGSTLLSSASITGGTLQGTPTGGFTTGGTSTLTNVTIAANTTVNIVNTAQINFAGTIELDGVVSISSSASTTELWTIGGDVIVNGDGQITMSNGSNNYIRASVSGQRFTFNNAGGIRGSGQIGVDTAIITNNTTIAASGSTGLRIDPVNVGGFDNNGVVLAETDSSLTILTGPFDNAGGVIRLQPNSTATLQGVSLTGGHLEGAADAAFVATSTPTLSGVTIDAGTLLRINNVQTMDITNGLVNNGEVRIDAAASNTTMRFNGNQTISGTGTVSLVAAAARMTAGTSNQRLTVVGNTIRGTGQIGVNTLAITNRGQILADVAGGITIDPPAGAPFINDVGGLVHASAATITVNSGGFTNSGGTVMIDATRKLDRTDTLDPYTQTAGLTLVNGEFEVDSNSFELQGGTLAGSGSTANNGWIDSNLTNTGGVISPGATDTSGIGVLTIEGTLTQSGNGETRIEIAGPTAAQHDKVVTTGAVTLGGNLRVVLLPGYDMMIGDSFDVMVGASRVGEFDSIVVENLPFALQFNVEMLSDRVRLVAAERCLGDYDLDGGITGADIAAFFADFEQGVLNADLDQDGGITGADIGEFFTRFENGC
jgi:filamentous hemagglutinin